MPTTGFSTLDVIPVQTGIHPASPTSWAVCHA